jgi:hypothetical protein
MTQGEGGEETKSSRGPGWREPHTYVARALAGNDRFWDARASGVLPARECLVEAYGELTNRTQVKRREAYVCGVEPAFGGKAQYPSGSVRMGDGSPRSSVFLPGEISRPPLRSDRER